MRSIGLALLLSGCATLPIKAPDDLKETIYDYVMQSGESFSSSGLLQQDGKREYFDLREGCGMVQASQVDEGTPVLFIDACVRGKGTTFGYSDFSSDVPQWIGERQCQCNGNKPVPIFSASENRTNEDENYYRSLLEKIFLILR